ncbi:hypothetical protein C8F04DRAFT_1075806 [Mycena alexandri]|uniref:Homeobox domain-containing protein n=1 Tax=Mycena alexandri TaxID=1745969 RepID=A0AAD6T9N1_9AGAR|nr:hypothetical protein C8F04DRAFT_1075806 [Mycena alexandri]
MCGMKTPLDVLADAAAQCTSPPACYDSHDSDHSSPSLSPAVLECRSEPSTPTNSGCHQLRPRKKAHRSHRNLRLHLKPKPELKVRRKELLERATAIKSLENSPVNEQQLFVLRTVFDEITMYPSEPWLVLMAIVLHRSLRQIKNWFSNERQKNRWGEVVSTHTDFGERLRLRPSATELCDQWSDAFFEEVLMIVNFRTARRIQWERAQSTSSFVTITHEIL